MTHLANRYDVVYSAHMNHLVLLTGNSDKDAIESSNKNAVFLTLCVSSDVDSDDTRQRVAKTFDAISSM